jgi:hypothetical protein
LVLVVVATCPVVVSVEACPVVVKLLPKMLMMVVAWLDLIIGYGV